VLRVTRDISIDDEELRFRFVRASGPGGQNVNKVATAAQLRFDVRGSDSLPEEVKRRLARLAGRRISGAGVLVIDARRYRTRERNRRDALERLAKLIRRAARRPKTRKPTAPTAASRRKRLDGKRRRSTLKRLRGPVPDE